MGRLFISYSLSIYLYCEVVLHNKKITWYFFLLTIIYCDGSHYLHVIFPISPSPYQHSLSHWEEQLVMISIWLMFLWSFCWQLFHDFWFLAEIEQSRSAHIGPFTVIGKGTKIGNNSKISNSVIGKGCSIGSNVSITGSYIWDSVTIEDGCDIRHAIICDGVVIKSGAALEPGVVLSFKVISKTPPFLFKFSWIPLQDFCCIWTWHVT